MFDPTSSDPTLDARHLRGGANRAQWSGVFAMTLCVGTLIASEFMPVSLLSPVAHDLHLTKGATGQVIAISGVFAVLSSLAISTVTRGIDRKAVLLVLSVLMGIAGLLVTLAPNYQVLMIGRAVLGIVIGGFWSMSAAIVMRLVPEKNLPKALSLLNGGNALATTISAPLGSYLGQYIGWRGAFFLVVPLAALTLVWQWTALPSLPSDRTAQGKSAFGVLRLPRASVGMIAVALLFMGQFALFTYIRPFLETITRIDVGTMSTILLMMGLAGLAGNALFAAHFSGRVNLALFVGPILMAAVAIGLVAFGTFPTPTALLLVVWGLIGTVLPVAWWSWLSRTFPADAEAAGGLMVAVIQLAITLGASLGGTLYDGESYAWTFSAAAALLCLSSITFFFASRRANRSVNRRPLLSRLYQFRKR